MANLISSAALFRSKEYKNISQLAYSLVECSNPTMDVMFGTGLQKMVVLKS